MLNQRVVHAIVVSNPIGFERRDRSELGEDPNRDFASAVQPAACMRTIVARAINEYLRRHMPVSGITFHGGMLAVAYEWGTPTHQAGHHQSPDEHSQAAIAHACSVYGGALDGQKYPVGRMNEVVYPVRGGMEDWAYSGSWDSQIACAPPTHSGYAAARTRYNAQQLRMYMLLIETADEKRPGEAHMGSQHAMLAKPIKSLGQETEFAAAWAAEGTADGVDALPALASFDEADTSTGHIGRNFRTCLTVLDTAAAYTRVLSVRSAAQPRRGLAADQQLSYARAAQDPARWPVQVELPMAPWPSVPHTARSALAGLLPSEDASVQVSWDVGGAATVAASGALWIQLSMADAVALGWAPRSAAQQLPACQSADDSVALCMRADTDPELYAWAQFVNGSAVLPGQTAQLDALNKAGVSAPALLPASAAAAVVGSCSSTASAALWTAGARNQGSKLGNAAAQRGGPWSARHGCTAQLQLRAPEPGSVIALVTWATTDLDWRSAPGAATPEGPPRTHLALARGDGAYSATHGETGERIVGTYHGASVPLLFAIAASPSGPPEASSDLASPSPFPAQPTPVPQPTAVDSNVAASSSVALHGVLLSAVMVLTLGLVLQLWVRRHPTRARRWQPLPAEQSGAAAPARHRPRYTDCASPDSEGDSEAYLISAASRASSTCEETTAALASV